MTTLTINVKEWEIPNLLQEVKSEIENATIQLKIAATKLEQIEEAQSNLKEIASNLIKNHQ